jgi:hypothetical protein
MSVYEKPDVYRIVAVEGGGVRVLVSGGTSTNMLEDSYMDVGAARAAIARAIRDGLPAFEILDETESAWATFV